MEPLERARELFAAFDAELRAELPAGVEVFDAHEPASARRSRVQPARCRGDERTEVQRSGGRGREPAGVHGCLEYTAALL